ncbi:MAG: polysaccharide pyruvyl transferase family protein [Desulfosalsimonadaceae bacterium]|nr:polysaccharide pyruvyl transferase family protein [Desulfosalsimonadaceae bacterium]
MNFSRPFDMSRRRWRRRLSPAKALFYSVRNSVCAGMVKNAVFGYWYPENNFGDRLTPDVLRYYGLTPFFTPEFDDCEVVSVGSILELVPESFKGTILGTGFLLPETDKTFPEARVLAVRGKLTARKLSLPHAVALGDPGILADRVYEQKISHVPKTYTLGVVPHYKEMHFPALRNFLKRYSDDICLINVCREPGKVIRDIAACRHIASSSLHGLVVAHSLGIPACPLTLSGKLRGGTFKFRDYYSIYDMEPVFHPLSGNESLRELCGLSTAVDPQRIAEAKDTLHSVFLNYANGKC